MNQKASDELVALASAEGFHLTPIYDPRLHSVGDSRSDVQGAMVYLDGREMRRVRRAYVGRDGWVDINPENPDGTLMVQDRDDALVIERHPGEVRIELPDGRVFD